VITQAAGIVAVAAVAGVAGWLSYWHLVDVVSLHGEPGSAGHLYPAIIDGTLIAASAVLTEHARRGVPAPRLAWVMAGLGVGCTLAGNLLYGLPLGWLAAVVAAVTAVMLLGCVELFMMLVRGVVSSQGAEVVMAAGETVHEVQAVTDETVLELVRGPADGDMVSSAVATDAESAALAALRATTAAGNPLSGNQLAARFRLTRAQVTRVRKQAASDFDAVSSAVAA
jgi:hypothetical protein